MTDAKPLIYGPQHETIEPKVKLPTIRASDDNGSISVQWTGKPNTELLPSVEFPDGALFLFPLMAPDHDQRFTMLTGQLHVPFLGQVKHWPAEDSVVKQMISMVGEGDPDKWIVWFLNPGIKLEGDRILSGCVPIVLLGDPNCGVIEPEQFSDLTVRDRALELFKTPRHE